jgi:hypothetical protein
MVFSVQSATEARIGHPEIAIIAKKEIVTGQFKRHFFDSSGTVHMVFIPEGATVNMHRHKGILRRLCNSFRRKRSEIWRRKNWLLIYKNAPAHCSVLNQVSLRLVYSFKQYSGFTSCLSTGFIKFAVEMISGAKYTNQVP